MKNVIFTYDTIQNGERGEACATILVDDAQAWALQAAFSGKDHTKAGYFLRERGIGFVGAASTSAAVGMLRTASRA